VDGRNALPDENAQARQHRDGTARPSLHETSDVIRCTAQIFDAAGDNLDSGDAKDRDTLGVCAIPELFSLLRQY
jgi:hypothetical protein